MSGTVAIVVVLGLLTVCGLGVLALLGAARSPGDLARMAPVAPLAGMAWIGIAAATIATVGVALGVVGFLAVTVATCAAGGVRLAARSDEPAEPRTRRRPRPLELAFAGASVVVLAVVAGFALATYGIKPLVEYDGWAMWGMKARAIALVDADPAVLASDAYARLHLEYPLLLPALHALPIDLAETFTSNIVVLNCVVIGLAGLLAIWGILRSRARPAVLLPFLAAIAALPAFFWQLGSGYADVPVAMLVAAGVAAAARWLVDEDVSWLALATLFLGASTLTKNEGLLFAVAVLVPLFAVAKDRRRAVAVSAGLVALVYAPWRAYTSVHDLSAPAYDLSSSFDLSLAGMRLRRIPESVEGVLDHALDPRELGFLLVLGVACSILAIVLGHTRLGVFALGFGALSLAGLSWIYVISPLEVSSFVGSSGSRVVVSAVLGLAALCPLLVEECARTLDGRTDSPAGSR